MKKIYLVIILLLTMSSVFAHTGEGYEEEEYGMMHMMMGSGMMGTMGTFGWGLYGLVYFIVVAFIFSVIFWWTCNWLVDDKKRR